MLLQGWTGFRRGEQTSKVAHLLQAGGERSGEALVACPQRLHLCAQLSALRLQAYHALQQSRPLVLHVVALQVSTRVLKALHV